MSTCTSPLPRTLCKKIFEWSQRPLPFSPRSRKHIHTHARTSSHFRFYTLFCGIFLITCKYNVNVDSFVMHFFFSFKVAIIMLMMAVFLLHSFLSRNGSNRLPLLCLFPSFSHSLAHFFCAWQPRNDQLPTIGCRAQWVSRVQWRQSPHGHYKHHNNHTVTWSQLPPPPSLRNFRLPYSLSLFAWHLVYILPNTWYGDIWQSIHIIPNLFCFVDPGVVMDITTALLVNSILLRLSWL